ncbi:hypothetical protein ASG43_08915 [Aureimonas sp. Leaf454]|uniref:hypothetical protein n=1 Tax=Aureimonas sp. Leaf454 TaxID=1736381 RepID=UPI0006FB627E|nr:hypothetical protein [Aureimonas sp. Leaf454]KQT48944.1 hypothetical protein ASG43_08915 [Aureimonas sp. Leaf454]
MNIIKAGPAPANDNARHADSFASLAERRAWLATLPAKAEPVLAWPTLERLHHLRDNEQAVRTLLMWRALNDAAAPVAANDNDPAVSDMDEDLRREIRPTIGELQAAVADVVFEEPSESRRQRATGRWPVGGDIERDAGGRIVRLGALRIGIVGRVNRGRIIEWGRTAKGMPLGPVDRPAAPKGKAKPKRTAESIAFYLSRRGTEWPAEYQGPAEARVVEIDRSPEVAKTAAELAKHGVDGDVDFDTARRNVGLAPTERGQPYVHPAARWVGGLTRFESPKQKGSVGELAAEVDMARTSALRSVKRFLTAREVEILDLALTDATAAEIGMAVGYSAEYSRKHGGRLVDEAIDAFRRTQMAGDEKLAA